MATHDPRTPALLRAERDALVAELEHAMDHTPWIPCTTDGGVTVERGWPAYAPGGPTSPVEGFHIWSEHDSISLDHGLSYFHDACHFADTANEMTTRSQIVEVLADDLDRYEAIVRTAFDLPWPLHNREFFHYVTTARVVDADGRDAVVIAYAGLPDDLDPPAWHGYLRCPMSPSGQRLTDLGNGRVRAEHCMTYPLVGAIPQRVQNTLFRGGHVSAYLTEWQAAMTRLAEESTRPVEAATRPAGNAWIR